MEHNKSRFRVTTWPEQPLPHPRPLLGGPLVVRDGVLVGDEIDGSLLNDLSDDAPPEAVEAKLVEAGMRRPSDRFDEVYLQLFTLDLDDEHAIAAWANEFGAFHVHARSLGYYSTETLPPHPYPKLARYPLFDLSDEPLDEDKAHLWGARMVEKEADETRAEAGFDDLEPSYLTPVTLNEFRWAAWCLRDLARCYWCLSTGTLPSTMAWDNPLIADSFGPQLLAESRDGESWWDEWEMREFLSATLRIGLDGFGPRLIDEELPRARGRQRTVALSEQFSASLDLFAVCCLELFNHIAERAIYKTCANDRCGRWFVRQQGRSEHDQRRARGVKFCSHRCARAHTQREYNRRRREQGTATKRATH